MILFKFIIAFIMLVTTTAVPTNKKDLSYEVKLPEFLTRALGIDQSWSTFRATLGSTDEKNPQDRFLSLSASNASDAYGRQRSQNDQKLFRVNLKGVDEAAAEFKSLLKPMAEIGSQVLLKSLFDPVRRSEEMRPRVELAPGLIKTEILVYPKNFLQKRLKHILKIQKQKEEENIING